MDVRMVYRVKLLSIIFLLISPSLLFSQTQSGAAFLRMEIGSRAQALGGAFAAVGGSPDGLHYNPAGTAFSHERSLLLYHAQWIADMRIENATLSYPLNNTLALGLGVSHLHMPTFTRYEIDPLSGGPLEAGTFNAYSLILTGGIGLRLGTYFALGSSVKYFHDSLESLAAGGVALDIGGQIRFPGSGLSLGMAAQNLGRAIQYQSQQSELPRTLRIGLAYRTGFAGHLLALDIVHVAGERLQLRPGMELRMNAQLFLRGGYRSNAGTGHGLNTGFGLKLLNNHQLNYAYSPYGDLGDSHRAEVVIHLGSVATAEETRMAARQRQTEQDARQVIREYTSGIASANASPAALGPLPPTSLLIEDLGEHRYRLSWEPGNANSARYHIYARRPESSHWVRITKTPTANTSQRFTRKHQQIHLQIAVTQVIGDRESERSAAMVFHTD